MTAQELNKYRKKRHYILKKSWQNLSGPPKPEADAGTLRV
jgi:hypothetical protein